MSTTKVITGKVRFSYVNIFKSRAFQAGQDAKYSVCLLIPKEDKATIKKIKAAIDAAVQDGISSKWGGKKPANLKLPLRDGDAERADEAPEYEGMYFLNCNSTQKPGIVDKEALTDPQIVKTAFNANFERTCLAKWLNKPMPPEEWRCTMVKALTLGLPGNLAGAGEALGLPAEKLKDPQGKALIDYQE